MTCLWAGNSPEIARAGRPASGGRLLNGMNWASQLRQCAQCTTGYQQRGKVTEELSPDSARARVAKELVGHPRPPGGRKSRSAIQSHRRIDLSENTPRLVPKNLE